MPSSSSPSLLEVAALRRELAHERVRSAELRAVLVQAKKTLHILGLKSNSPLVARMRAAIDLPRTVTAENGKST